MQIDPSSLLVLTALAALGAGVLMFGAWLGWGRPKHLLIWSGAQFLTGITIAGSLASIIAGNVIAFEPVGIGMALVPALIWAGTRSFLNLPVGWLAVAAGPVLSVATLAGTYFAGLQAELWMLAAVCAIWPLYAFAAARDLWRSRQDRLMARLPLVVLLGLHGACFIPGAIYLLLVGHAEFLLPSVTTGFGVVYFETILFVMGSTIAMLILHRERVESTFRESTRFDMLTGASTRRSFFEIAQRLADRAAKAGEPISLIMFDLDHFKRINDTRGHVMGDRVLKGFADSVRLLLRPSDVFGRFGGEEFIVLLPATPIESAIGIAERIRRDFCESFKTLDGRPLKASVSAGVAMLMPGGSFDEAMWEADRALYAAKEAGRNRVRASSTDEESKVVRIA
jgi:diguanylate cyclase (GGDEF)-like protein